MDSARAQSKTNLHRTPSESTQECVWKPGGKDKEPRGGTAMDLTTDIPGESRDSSVKRGRTGRRREESACGSKEFDAPFPWATTLRNGSSTSRVRGGRNPPAAGAFLPPPRCALDRSGTVPKHALPIRKRGPMQRRQKPADAALDSWPSCGQQGGTGALPLRPRSEKIQKLSGVSSDFGQQNGEGKRFQRFTQVVKWQGTKAVIEGFLREIQAITEPPPGAR